MVFFTDIKRTSITIYNHFHDSYKIDFDMQLYNSGQF